MLGKEIMLYSGLSKIDLGATSHGVQEVAECGFVNPKTTPILPKILTEIDFSQLLEWTEVKIFSDGLTAT